MVDLLRFSWSALRGHRLRAILSLLGVAIGVASVIVLTSLGEGAKLYVAGEFATLGTNLLIVLPGHTETSGLPMAFGGVPHDLTVQDAELLPRRIPRVVRVAPLVLGAADVRYGGRSRQILVLGTTAELAPLRNLEMGSGRFLPAEEEGREAPVCVIGTQVQHELFGHANPLGRVLRIGDYRFRVIGVTAPRGTSLGTNLDEAVFVPVSTALRMFNQRTLFRIMVEVRSHEEIELARAQVRQILKERHSGEEDVTVLTPDAVAATFNRILAMLTAALAGIAAISLGVAGIGIMNVMLVSVSERKGEVGLMKALGATEGQVVQVFLLEAALLSTSGGLCGLAVGYGASGLLQLLVPDFPARPPLWAVLAAVLVSISVGVLFGALPARRAARLNPVTALARR